VDEKPAEPTMISLLKLKAILTMSAVFALGAIIGASWGGIVVSRYAASAPLAPQRSKPGMVEKFRTRLNLSPEQTQSLELVLDETQREFSQLHVAVRPRFEEIRQRMRLGIRQILDEEQQREYDVMIRERDEQRARRETDGRH